MLTKVKKFVLADVESPAVKTAARALLAAVVASAIVAIKQQFGL